MKDKEIIVWTIFGFWSLLLMFILSGCNSIKDDLNACPVYLKLSYQYNMENENKIHEINRVKIYFFDRGGAFLSSQEVQIDKMPIQGIELSPFFRNQQAVIWGGELDPDYIFPDLKQGEPYSKLVFSLNKNSITSALSPLFFGKSDNLSFSNDYNTSQIVDMMKFTNLIRIHIISQREHIITPYNIIIEEDGNSFGSDGRLINGTACAFKPYKVDKNIAYITVMRILKEEQLKLVITSDNDDKLTFGDKEYLDLSQYLLTNKPTSMEDQEFLDRKNEWDVYINTDGAGTVLSVVINDWTVWLQQSDL